MTRLLVTMMFAGCAASGVPSALSQPPRGQDTVFASGFEGQLLDYLGARHTIQQCADAGGEVVSVSGDSDGTEVCRFDSAMCPSGWSLAGGWSTTQETSTPWSQPAVTPFPTTCNGITYDWPAVASESGMLNSGAHAFSNLALIESQSCQLWQGSAIEIVTGCDDASIATVIPIPSSIRCVGFGANQFGFLVDFQDGGGSLRSRWLRVTTQVTATAERIQVGCK